MRFSVLTLLLTGVLFLGYTLSWADAPVFNAVMEQRELVVSVPFGRGSSTLDEVAQHDLDLALDRIRKAGCDARLIRVEGFASKEGADEANMRLSMNRAYSVFRFLQARGVPCIVGLNGYGDLKATGKDSLEDQRVEIVAYPKMYLFDFENARYVDEVK